jgi:hypothetical protein
MCVEGNPEIHEGVPEEIGGRLKFSRLASIPLGRSLPVNRAADKTKTLKIPRARVTVATEGRKALDFRIEGLSLVRPVDQLPSLRSVSASLIVVR